MVNLILRIAAFIIVFFAATGVLMAIRRMQIPSRVRKAEEMLKSGQKYNINLNLSQFDK